MDPKIKISPFSVLILNVIFIYIMFSKFNNSQLKTLSKVCSDISKALILAIILGQGIITQTTNAIRYQLVISWVLISTFLLILAMMIDKNIKYE